MSPHSLDIEHKEDIENNASYDKEQIDIELEVYHHNRKNSRFYDSEQDDFGNDDSGKLHGFLSRQFPTIANPAPLGLCGKYFGKYFLIIYFSCTPICSIS